MVCFEVCAAPEPCADDRQSYLRDDREQENARLRATLVIRDNRFGVVAGQ
jgi:hypothetical protein